MISALEGLGSNLSNSSLLDNKISKIVLKKTESYICKIDFKLEQQNKIEISFESVNEENSKQLATKYKWVGNLKGSIPQWHITTDNFVNIINVIPILENKLKGTEYKLKDKIDKVYNKFYSGQDFTVIVNDKPYHNINIQNTKNRKEIANYFLEKVDKIDGYIKNICLFTVLIDGDIIANEADYNELLEDSLIVSDDKSYVNGVCSVCGKNGPVTADTTKFMFKYYNNDKISFSSNVSSNFAKNFSICKRCYSNIVNAENYSNQKLSSYLGSLKIMIIPECLPSNKFQLDIQKVFNVTKSVIHDNADSLKKIETLTSGSYLINIMFYKQSNNYFKIIDIIPEIPESRVNKIRDAFIKVNDKFNSIIPNFSDKYGKYLNISEIYRMVNTDQKTVYGYSLTLISDLFKFKRIDQNRLIRVYTKKISLDYYDNSKNINGITSEIIRMVAYLEFFKTLDLIIPNVRIENFNGVESNMEEEEFVKKIRYTEEEEALFWLGYLTDKIGRVMFKNNIKNNPMLEKINFQGMNFTAIEKFVNQVDEKIKQYNIYGKDINYALSRVHAILSKYVINKSEWKVDDVSNVFLIMTGYSVSRSVEKTQDTKEDENGE
jgi:CRISPR-associated protein Csh1